MFRIVRWLFTVSCITYLCSCSLINGESYAERFKKELESLTDYNLLTEKNKDLADLTIEYKGDKSFINSFSVYDVNNRNSSGGLKEYKFGTFTQLQIAEDGVEVLTPISIFGPAINELKMIGNEPFIFSVSASKYSDVDTSWYQPKAMRSVRCNINGKKFAFTPLSNEKYLLSFGANPSATEKDSYTCYLEIMQWNKKTKNYIKIPFSYYE